MADLLDDIVLEEREEEASDEQEPTLEEPSDEEETVSEEVSEEEDDTDSKQQSKQDDDDEQEESNEESNEDDEEELLVVDILEQSGFEYEDEELEGIDDSKEGLQKTIDVIAKKKAEAQYKNELGKYTDVQEYLDFRKNGGSPQDYFEARQQQASIESLEITEDDVITQRDVVRQNLKNMGYEKEDIQAEINELEESDRLYARAERNLSTMKKQAQEQKQQVIEQQKQKQQQNIEKRKEMIAQARQMVNNNEIPVESSDELVDFFFGNGEGSEESEYVKKGRELDLKGLLTIAAIVKNGGRIDGLIESKADKKSVEKLKERLKKKKKGGGLNNNSPEHKSDPIDDLDKIEFS